MEFDLEKQKKRMERLSKDLKENPPQVIEFSAEADPKLVQRFMEHECAFNRKENPVTGASGGAISFQFTPTSLGIEIKLICACGKEDSVTDHRSW